LLRRVEAVGSGGSRRSRPSPTLRPGGRVPKQTAVRELVDAPVAERVAAQQSPAGQDRSADRTKLADRLDRVGRAGRGVAAAWRHGGRYPALVGPNRGDQQSLEQAFHDKRSSSEVSMSSA